MIAASAAQKKLLDKLQTLESDVLFDKDAADAQWTERRHEIMQIRSERKRLRIENDSQDTKNAQPSARNGNAVSKSILDEAEEMGRKLLDEAEGDDSGLLSGIFDAPTELGTSSSTQVGQTEASNVVIRSFGKLSGLSPRRVLEDACRSRFVTSISATRQCRNDTLADIH